MRYSVHLSPSPRPCQPHLSLAGEDYANEIESLSLPRPMLDELEPGERELSLALALEIGVPHSVARSQVVLMRARSISSRCCQHVAASNLWERGTPSF